MSVSEWTPGSPPVVAGRYDTVMDGMRQTITIEAKADGERFASAVPRDSASKILGAKICYDDGGIVPYFRWKQITEHYATPDPISVDAT